MCASGERFRVYLLRPPSTTWSIVDEVCIGPSTPVVTQAQLSAAARSAFSRLPLPPAHARVQPPDGAVVGVPTIFYTEAQPALTDTTSLAGITVTVRAEPTMWTWTAETGATISRPDPGQPYPNHTTTHTYRRPGTYPLALTTTWTGVADIAGLGTEPVGTRDIASASVPVQVRQGRTQLVAD